MEEAVQDAVLPPKDLSSLIVKGKRTKRMRPHSPIPFNVGSATHSSLNCNSDVINHINNISPPPSSSDEGGGMANNVVEEDEEMANCLILLSQGNPIIMIKESPNYKFTSKRYIEAPISSNGKAGMYVYQCKTCGRTFPSFQALGGHRASHKKPKNIATLEANKVVVAAFSDDEEEAFRIKNYYKSKKPPPLSLELSNWSDHITNKLSPLPKIHECSYCGAQFASGQALGGHMRRHRGPPVTPATTPSTNTTLSLSPFPISPASINQESDQDDIDQGKKRKSALTLDLNLPAPDENHQQKQKQQQPQTTEQGLVLSTGRFIECRY